MTRRDEQDEVSGQGWLLRPGRLARSLWAGRPAWLRSRWLLVLPSALVFAGLVAGLVSVLAASGNAPAPRPGPAALNHPNPDSTEPPPRFQVPAQVVPVALPSTGAIPLPVTEQPQVTAWNAGPGGSALKKVSRQAGTVAQASGLKHYTDMKSACSQLAVSVVTAQDGPPIPVAAMQRLYRQALTELASAAGQCRAAISEQPDGDEYVATTENQDGLRAAAAALASGTRDLFRATGQIAALGQDR